MSCFHPAWIEHQRKRFTRHDAHRFIRPDADRFLKPGAASPRAPEQAGTATDQMSEAERLQYRWKLARLRFDWEMFKLWVKARKYNPNQPRVPAGNPDGGQWTSEGAQGSSRVRIGDQNVPVRLAQAGFGMLIVEIPRRGGRNCVYKFPSFSVIVAGPTNRSCARTAHWSAVTHGRLLNDN